MESDCFVTEWAAFDGHKRSFKGCHGGVIHVKMWGRMTEAKGTISAMAPRQEQEWQVWGIERRPVKGTEAWDENRE